MIFLTTTSRMVKASWVKLPAKNLSHRFKSSIKASTSAYQMLENKNLVSIQDCLDAFRQNKNDLVFVDASWYHRENRNGRAEFERGPRIVGSKHIDMDDISAQKDLFPTLNPKGLLHMLPPKELFALAMDEFGVQNDNHVVIYGREGCYFTPRTWFLFRQMGHLPEKVHLMQGSFEEWVEAGGPIEAENVTVPLAKDILESHRDGGGKSPSYNARDPVDVVDIKEMLAVVPPSSAYDDVLLLDPRGSKSFLGNGHIPGTFNIPYASLVEPNNTLKLKSKEELLEIFADAGIDAKTNKKIICTCGSGVSVCHLVLALEECGRDDSMGCGGTLIYDGSWNEWGSDQNTPKTLPSDDK